MWSIFCSIEITRSRSAAISGDGHGPGTDEPAAPRRPAIAGLRGLAMAAVVDQKKKFDRCRPRGGPDRAIGSRMKLC